jgi:uncharacterized protein (TIGR02145 family)
MENYVIDNGYNFDGTTTSNKIGKALAATTNWLSSSDPGIVGNSDYPDKRNTTGFSALPGGVLSSAGSFNFVGNSGYWWSATEGNNSTAWYRHVIYSSIELRRVGVGIRTGFSVRCLKD